ncbi:hypothetical protein OIDMADRAFT_102782 [Oidiodendron maius Zn]|uniref:C2H2-type domain-containing protein n=1 Tax=Oidiodendron maius (strain Zn) TaxID=913774 RepID=A0A0C3HI16_OIDMZ|nr:hypothetical protein OIDMADRAFT_102782 [Oidiodendron maius Zn]
MIIFAPFPFSHADTHQRHERGHTGARPYVCKECKRPFARQDALARHEKLHTRTEYSQCPSPPASHASKQSLLSPSSSGQLAVSDNGSATTRRTGTTASAPPEYMDFDLIWPDSEELLENLVSLDSSTQWQSSLGTLPISIGGNGTSNTNFESVNSFHDKTSSIGVIPCGESHQAVHNVSEMVTALSSTVTAAVEATSITSVFLDECLHMFFVRFIPTFPVLHRSTFVFRECTKPLLLNAMAIGSLYLGPKDSIEKGEALWRLAHVAIATSWETLITHRGPYDPCPGVQLVVTALLGQVYGALSKNRAIRTTSQAFHALSFFWARQCSVSEKDLYAADALPPFNASDSEKDKCWRTWAAKEIQQRAVLGHYLLDGLVSRMSDGMPSVRHTANRYRPPSTEAIFEARTADEWISQLGTRESVQYSFRSIVHSLFQPASHGQILNGHIFSAFSFRVILEGLQSLVSDCDSEDFPILGVPTKSELRQALAQVQDCIANSPHLSNSERLETLLRWHTICLDACIDSSHLCRSICARYDISQHVCPVGGAIEPDIDIITWVHTVDARRSLLHAIAIQEIVEQLPRGRAHVIHIPSSLFAAATVYVVFSLGGQNSVNTPNIINWQTALSTDFDSSLLSGQPDGMGQSETQRYMRGEYSSVFGKMGTTQNLLYELNSMQKLFRCLCSQWGIAYDMADVLDQWNALCH